MKDSVPKMANEGNSDKYTLKKIAVCIKFFGFIILDHCHTEKKETQEIKVLSGMKVERRFLTRYVDILSLSLLPLTHSLSGPKLSN